MQSEGEGKGDTKKKWDQCCLSPLAAAESGSTAF